MKNNWQLQIAVFIKAEEQFVLREIYSFMFYYTLFGLFRRGGSKTSLKLLFLKNINQKIEPKFSQNIPVYIDFDGASPILAPSCPLSKKMG